MVRLFLLLIIIGCGKIETPQNNTPQIDYAALKEKYLNLLEQVITRLEDHGWPAADECDGALWAGVAAAAGVPVDIAMAVQPSGRPTRLPGKDCMPGDTHAEVNCFYDAPCMGGAASTTSNDMWTGILMGLHAKKDIDSLEKMYTYGIQNSWVVGYPTSQLDRVFIRPNGRTILARMLYQLSEGRINPAFYRVLPIIYDTTVVDYELHLQLLGLNIAKNVGYFESTEQLIANSLCDRNPTDAYSLAICGRGEQASKLILGDYQVPAYVRGHPAYGDVHRLLILRSLIPKEL